MSLAEGAQGLIDTIDLGRVAKVREAVDLLLGCAYPPGKFDGTNVLPQHFIQQDPRIEYDRCAHWLIPYPIGQAM